MITICPIVIFLFGVPPIPFHSRTHRQNVLKISGNLLVIGLVLFVFAPKKWLKCESSGDNDGKEWDSYENQHIHHPLKSFSYVHQQAHDIQEIVCLTGCFFAPKNCNLSLYVIIIGGYWRRQRQRQRRRQRQWQWQQRQRKAFQAILHTASRYFNSSIALSLSLARSLAQFSVYFNSYSCRFLPLIETQWYA